MRPHLTRGGPPVDLADPAVDLAGPPVQAGGAATVLAMAEISIFHNPRCSKSRQAMATASDAGVDVTEVRYLDAPPDRATLEHLVAILEDPVVDLVRRGDAKKAGVDVPADADAATVVEVLVAHPALMERPVLVRGDRAIIGRPTERVAPFLAG